MKKINLVVLLLTLMTSVLFGQRSITGTITDQESGEALIGASVIVANTVIGTATSFDGSFSLNIPKDAASLKISYTGYDDLIVAIDDRSEYNLTMKAGKELDEVIVIGYGTVKKSDATGAVGSIRPEDEQVDQYDNFQDFMQGRAAGVYIQSNGSEIGAPNTIRIRGTNSLRGDNEPLYVVDGIIINSATEDTADPLSGGSSYLSPQNGLNGISTQDIESIEILKDASATAIYGSRGANGVILITTKKGKTGKTKFNYRVNTRTGRATNLIDVLSADEFVDYQNEYRAQEEWDPLYYRYPDGSLAQFKESNEFMESKSDSIPRLNKTDWYDEVLQNSFSQNHRFTISGGKENSTYYIATGFGNSQGIVPGQKATQGDVLLNLTQELNSRLSISPRISASYNRNEASKGTENLGSVNTSIIRQTILQSPLTGFPNDRIVDGNVFLENGPIGFIEDYDDDSNEFRGLASIKLDYKISNVFTYRFLAGGDYRNKKRQIWYGTNTQRGRIANGEAGLSTLNRFRYNIDNTLMFKKKLGRKNRIDGTVGVVYDATNLEQTSFSASNFSNKDLRYQGISFGQVYEPLVLDRSEEDLLSFLGRVNYNFSGKYIFTVSFRGDGTSKFADGNKFSFFPSAAFAWKIMNESFMENNTFFSEAKFRLGYGRTGSQAIRPYQTLNRFGPTANLLSDGNGNGVTAIVPLNLGNPNLIWETTDQVNAGFDFGFKDDRFTGSVDVYYKQTYDLLQTLNIGPSAGFSTIVTNQGNLTNRGIELSLNAHILEGPFKWNVFGNISMNRNRINELGLPPTQFGNQTYSAFIGRNVSGGTVFKVPANIFIEGQPAALFWGYETDGIVSTDAELENAPSVQGVDAQMGDVLYIDQNGDGNISDLDLTVIGDPNPDFNYGFGSEFSYKSWSLNFFFNGVFGNDIANGNLGREDYAFANNDNIRRDAYTNAWRETNPNGTHPRLGYQVQGDFTDRYVEDGTFLRMTYVTLGYSLPSNTIKGIDKASVFVSGHNLLLITKYSGFDPEVNSFAFDATRQGIDWNSFPNQKSFSVGLNLTF